MKKDLFVFDLDGTLVHKNEAGERKIPTALLEAVHQIGERAHVVVATGRRFRSAKPDIDLLPDSEFAICHNGLVIKDRAGKSLASETMETNVAIEIANLLRAKGLAPFFCCDAYESNCDYVLVQSWLADSPELQRVEERTSRHHQIIASTKDLEKVAGNKVIEICCLAEYAQLLQVQAEIAPLLPANQRAIVVKNIGYEGLAAMEIFPRKISKGQAACWVAGQVGASRMIAFGDDENDIELLQIADFSSAMGHAQPHVQRAAKQTLKNVDAFVDYLSTFYLPD